MLIASLYTDYELDSQKKAVDLLTFLKEHGGVFAPTRYGSREPLKKVFSEDDLSEPAGLLRRPPDHRAGSIRLKGAKHSALAWINWSRGSVSSWDMYLDDKFFGKSEQTTQFIEFVAELCRRFPILYGGAAPGEDWDAKHWRVERGPTGGEAQRKMGLELDECLPGVYWLTVFGNKCAEALGRNNFKELDKYRIVDLGSRGILVVLREEPFKPGLKERLQHDKVVMNTLGGEYFFTLDHPERKCIAIPGVTRGRSAGMSSDQERPDSDDTKRITEEELMEIEVPNPDGGVYTDPRELTTALVTLLHMDVNEVFKHTREALQAMDSYFAKHRPRREYYDETLVRDIIPALGAYLGQVLVRQLSGKWQVRQPILKSVVMVNGKEISPFRSAYKTVYGNEKLVDIYDMVSSWKK